MGPISRIALFVLGGAIEFVCAWIGWTALMGSLQLFSSSHEWLKLISIAAIVFSGIFCSAVFFAAVFMIIIGFDFSDSSTRNPTVMCF